MTLHQVPLSRLNRADYSNSTPHCLKGKKVRFTVEALEMAKKRAKLSATSTRMKTPPKRSPPPKIIGSSCTWRTAELQELKVAYTEKEVDCKSLFDKPERWFNFDDLVYYKKVKEQLLSIGSLAEARDRDVLLDKAPWWDSVFADFSALHIRETLQRKENLSTKRKARSNAKNTAERNSPPSPSIIAPKQKRTTATTATGGYSVDVEEASIPESSLEPSNATPTFETTRAPSSQQRVASNATIADHEQNSGEGPVTFAVREKECDRFANSFCSETIQLLWRKGGLKLDWVVGRKSSPRLIWRNGALIGAMRLGKDTVFAQTDGGLQIVIPRKGDDGNELDEEIVYERAYYELALESKQFFKWVKSDVPGEGTVDADIDSTEDPIHAAQIFAEMLTAINHPEFTSIDQEAFVILNKHTRFQLYHCVFPREYLCQVRDKGFADITVTLNRTKTYDFADVCQRGEWFDLFVALLQYLKSGEAKVGYLNQLHPKNALHRDIEESLLEEESSPQLQTSTKSIDDKPDWCVEVPPKILRSRLLPRRSTEIEEVENADDTTKHRESSRPEYSIYSIRVADV